MKFNLETIKSYFTNPEVLQRFFITLILLFAFRLLSKVPAPGVQRDALESLFGGSEQGIFNIANILAGGTLTQFSIISVGLFSYISASVIFQLLGQIVPRIKEIQKMGEVGRSIINQWTRLLTVPLSAFQAFAIYLVLKEGGGAFGLQGQPVIEDLNLLRIITLIIVLVAGTMLLMWIAELVSIHGLGGSNGGGISLIITTGILASLPTSITAAFSNVSTSNFFGLFWTALAIETILFLIVGGLIYSLIKIGQLLFKLKSKYLRFLAYMIYSVFIASIPAFVLYVNNVDNKFTSDILLFLNSYTSRLEEVEIRLGFYTGLTLQLVVLITYFNEAVRKIQIKFINRIRSRNTPNQSESYIPIKLLAVGVMPIIFSSSLLLLPQIIQYFFGARITQASPEWGAILNYAASSWLNQLTSPYYYALNFVLIVWFSMFFITIIMDPADVASSLKHRKTFIPNVRPNQETEEFLTKVILRISFWGGLFIGLLTTIPFLLGIYNSSVSSGIENFIGGGASILIVVATVMMIKIQLDAIVLTKNYEKFEEL